MNGNKVLIPIVVATINQSTEMEVNNISLGCSYGSALAPIYIPSGLRSKSFRITIEALDVTAELEES